MTAAALILAAGRSTRFGTDKLVAEFRGRPMIEHVIDAALAAGLSPVVVVVGPDREIRWPSVRIVVNPDPSLGISSSLQSGLAALEGESVSRVVVLLADQPLVSPAVIATLLAQPVERPIVVPRYAAGEPGNPVVLERSAWPFAAETSGDRGMVQLFAAQPGLVRYVDVPGANPDVDTAAQLSAFTLPVDPRSPQLIPPTSAVRDSYIVGEREMAREEGRPSAWLGDAARNFDAFVADRRAVRIMWTVPVTELWYVDGDTYIGTVMVRHELTLELERVGGNVGYHVVPSQRRRGHATRMLAEAVRLLCAEGNDSILVTCAPDNTPSRRVIERNEGRLVGEDAGVVRYEIKCRRSITPA